MLGRESDPETGRSFIFHYLGPIQKEIGPPDTDKYGCHSPT